MTFFSDFKQGVIENVSNFSLFQKEKKREGEWEEKETEEFEERKRENAELTEKEKVVE